MLARFIATILIAALGLAVAVADIVAHITTGDCAGERGAGDEDTETGQDRCGVHGVRLLRFSRSGYIDEWREPGRDYTVRR